MVEHKINAIQFEIKPIGIIRNIDNLAWLEIELQYQKALEGLEQFSHIHVFYWLHKNDTPEFRAFLKVHPCGNPENPLTGVFATHSPKRPNPIALTRCHITGIEPGRVFLDEIDAFDQSPLIDIKSYFPLDTPIADFQVPDWK
ncbi:tRNA (N6-threonylcarbamoyladenosine(37)-N6)-methyltransferase TrmO [Desulfobacterales bacterium HSG17]|nr:tRNA (N6-threonylcarbamoyladenosine(37)-N6)-methyltransferase TrmO [Desulfobacterales bacterium HSG17]